MPARLQRPAENGPAEARHLWRAEEPRGQSHGFLRASSLPRFAHFITNCSFSFQDHPKLCIFCLHGFLEGNIFFFPPGYSRQLGPQSPSALVPARSAAKHVHSAPEPSSWVT